jgi:hypothetical protein
MSTATVVLDADFTQNSKVLCMSGQEFRLYINSIFESRRNKTAGRISGDDLRKLLAESHANQNTVNALVTLNAWELDGESGFRIHDYRQEDAAGSKRKGEARQVYQVWRESTGTKTTLAKETKADKERMAVIEMRLREYPLEDVMDAVRGWVNDDWEERAKHNDVKLLLRNGTQLEKFRDLWRNPPHKKNWVEEMRRKMGV